MTLTRRSPLRSVVATVSRALTRHGIRGVLTGGACASLHARGEYLSHDLDYILEGAVTRRQLDAAMGSVGFARTGAAYLHRETPFLVEFPAGPLAIGDDDLVKPVELRVGRARVPALSATDSCRDRLAAFYHWRDLQSLRVAVAIARHQPIDLSAIQSWSAREGHEEGFRRFQQELEESARLRPLRRLARRT